MDNYTTSWAELDQSNRQHYGRGKPALLLRCESLLEEYAKELRRDDLDAEYVLELLNGFYSVEAWKQYVYDRWQIEQAFNRHWSDDPRHWAELEY